MNDEQYYQAHRIEQMNPEFIASFVPMAKEFYEATGRKLRVTDTFRTNAEQADLYRRKPNLAAPPGKSRHETGDAMDIHTGDVPDLERLGLLEKHGFHRPVLHKGETWHIERKQADGNFVRGLAKVAGHVWGLVSPREAQAADDDALIEAGYYESREQAERDEFQQLLTRFSPSPQGKAQGQGETAPGGQPGKPPGDVVGRAVPGWAGGSLLDLIERNLPSQGSKEFAPDMGALADPGMVGAAGEMVGKAIDAPFIPLHLAAQYAAQGLEKLGGPFAYRPETSFGNLLRYALGKEQVEGERGPSAAEMIAGSGELLVFSAYARLLHKAGSLLNTYGTKAFYKHAPDWMFRKGEAGLPEVISPQRIAEILNGMSGPERAAAARKYPEFRAVLEEMTSVGESGGVAGQTKQAASAGVGAGAEGQVLDKRVQTAVESGKISQSAENNVWQIGAYQGATQEEAVNKLNENLVRGDNAMDYAIQNQTDSFMAMERDDTGPISFYWGKEGNPQKDFAGGSGLSHIIAKRNAEGLDGEAIARQMPEVIAFGEAGEPYGPSKGQRKDVTYDGHTAVLSLYKHGEKEIWLLTGWKDENPSGGHGVSTNPQAYAPQTFGSRSEVGAEGLSKENIPTPGGKVNPDDDITMGADFGLGWFFKKFFKEEGVGSGVKAGEPGTVPTKTESGAPPAKAAGIEIVPRQADQPLYPLDKTDRFLTEPFQAELKDGKYAVNINLQRIESPEEITDAIRKMAELEGVEMDTARRGVMSFEDTERLAEMVGLTPEKLLSRQSGQAFNAEEALAARRLLVSAAAQVRELAAKASSLDGSANDLLEFRRALSVMAGIQQQVAGMTAEAGRALSAFRIMATETKLAEQMVKDWLESGGGEGLAKKMAEKLSGLETPEQLAKVVAKAWKATSWDVFLEIWINGLLSGPLTHMRNVLGNLGAAFIQVPERWAAGQISRALGGEVARGEAAALTWGLTNGFREGLLLAGKALRTGESSDLLGKIEIPRRALSAAALDMSGTAGRAVDFMGEIVRSPGRALMSTDEFFKAVGYRMELHAQAYRMATQEGLQGEALAQRMAEILADPPAQIKLAGIDAARYQTFTQEAGPIAQAITKMANQVPVLKLIVPFVRTPSNIFRFTLQRTPLAPLMTHVREDIRAGGERRDLALARMSLGSMIMATAAGLAAGGYITGGGPQKKELRENLLREGWQPYSIKIGDTYYQVGGLEPVGTLLGLAADFTELAGQAPDAQADEFATMAAAAVGKVFTNKTFMQGLASAMEAVIDPGRYGRNWLQRFAASLVPFTSLSGTIARQFDPEIRETRAGREAWLPALQTMLNEMKSRIPGLSADLPPRRNLWGESLERKGSFGPDILSPIYTTSRKHSPIDMEMIRNDVAISMPRRQVYGTELTAQEYDRYVALAGNELKVNGLGCKDYLNKMVKTEEYRRQSQGENGGRASMITDIVEKYRKAAAAKLLQEFPELHELVIENKQQKAQGLEPEW